MAKMITLFIFLVVADSQFVFKKVSLDMHTRTARNGSMSTTKASIFYTSEGKMVTYFTEPEKVLISNTKKGDVLMYHFDNNSVLQRQNYLFSTENNQLYFFLENNISDLGLSRMGFKVTGTRFEDGLKITTWAPPSQMRAVISKVELAHNKNNPVFLGYYDIAGKFQKKTFFYNYERHFGIAIPMSMTQISYPTPNDSIVSKTIYTDIKFDKEVSDEYLNFEIPKTAVVIK